MLKRVRDGFDCTLHVVAGAIMVLLLSTVSAGIISRGLNHPFSWTDELSGFLMVWLACFGWMIATRRNAHIRIRFFHDLLPAGGHAWVETAIQAGAIIFGAVVAWNSVRLIHTNSDIEATTMPIAAAWLYAPLLPAGLLTIAQAAIDIHQRLAMRNSVERPVE